MTEEVELRPRRTLLRRLAGWAESGGSGKLRRRSPALDATFEAIERDSDIGGAMLAGALSYRLFVFALPLAFFLISAAGLVADALGIDPGSLPESVGLASAVTKQVAAASNGSTNWWVALSSFLVLAYATRVLFRAISVVHALAWEHSAAAVKVRARRLGVFAGAALGQMLLGFGVSALHHRSPIGGLVAVVAYVVALAALWLVMSLQVPHADAGWLELVPGSILYGIGLTGVGLFNILLLGRLIESKSTAYGALGVAATLLLGLFLIGRVMVGAAVLNATLHDRRRAVVSP